VQDIVNMAAVAVVDAQERTQPAASWPYEGAPATQANFSKL
jgi:hypothetical protein